MKKSEISEVLHDIHTYGIHSNTREIYLGNKEDENEEVNQAVALNFIKNINFLNSISDSTILIHMISSGGHWSWGMAIYDAIKNSRSNTVLLAYGMAGSMASIMPQAATWRAIMPYCDVLVHHGQMEVDGNFTSVEKHVEWASKITKNQMLEIYTERTKDGPDFKSKKRSQIKNYWRQILDRKQEVYMTAEESINKGLFDGIFGKTTGYRTIDELRT